MLSRRALIFSAVALALPRTAAAADDYEAVGGHFFGQTRFGVGDAEAPFWAAFREIGGADAIGFPTSRRFEWHGRTTQLFQRGALVHDPFQKRVDLANVMDSLHAAGRDSQLHRFYGIPRHVGSNDAGKPWPRIVAERQARLDGDPAIRAAYFSAAHPERRYGLPTSGIEDFDSHRSIRLQRGVLQLWTRDVPWARAGDVTEALVGDIARDLGLFGPPNAAVFAAEEAWQPAPAPAPEPPPLPAVVRPPSIGPSERWIDVDLARQWLTLLEGDGAIHGNGVTSGKPGFATPRGLFRVYARVLNETMDSLTTGIPRSAPEGYFLKDIFFTQYFAAGGYALHSNYWQPASVFGVRPTSHGCVGMRQADAGVVWNATGYGTKVFIH